MKIIKLFFLVAISLCATNLLHAQEAVTTPVKAVDLKPAAIVTSPPAPPLQPGSTVAPQTVDEKLQAVPLASKEERNKQPEAIKPVFITIDGKPATKPLTPEQIKTLNGKTEKPVPVIIAVPKEQ